MPFSDTIFRLLVSVLIACEAIAHNSYVSVCYPTISAIRMSRYKIIGEGFYKFASLFRIIVANIIVIWSGWIIDINDVDGLLQYFTKNVFLVSFSILIYIVIFLASRMASIENKNMLSAKFVFICNEYFFICMMYSFLSAFVFDGSFYRPLDFYYKNDNLDESFLSSMAVLAVFSYIRLWRSTDFFQAKHLSRKIAEIGVVFVFLFVIFGYFVDASTRVFASEDNTALANEHVNYYCAYQVVESTGEVYISILIENRSNKKELLEIDRREVAVYEPGGGIDNFISFDAPYSLSELSQLNGVILMPNETKKMNIIRINKKVRAGGPCGFVFKA